MSEKLKQLMKELPENKYNVSETARKVGMSESYSKSGTLYKTIRESATCLKYSKPVIEIRDEFLRTLDKDIRRFKKEKDNTAYMRAVELKSKILALQINKNMDVPPDEGDQFSLDRLSKMIGSQS